MRKAKAFAPTEYQVRAAVHLTRQGVPVEMIGQRLGLTPENVRKAISRSWMFPTTPPKRIVTRHSRKDGE